MAECSCHGGTLREVTSSSCAPRCCCLSPEATLTKSLACCQLSPYCTWPRDLPEPSSLAPAPLSLHVIRAARVWGPQGWRAPAHAPRLGLQIFSMPCRMSTMRDSSVKDSMTLKLHRGLTSKKVMQFFSAYARACSVGTCRLKARCSRFPTKIRGTPGACWGHRTQQKHKRRAPPTPQPQQGPPSLSGL